MLIVWQIPYFDFLFEMRSADFLHQLNIDIPRCRLKLNGVTMTSSEQVQASLNSICFKLAAPFLTQACMVAVVSKLMKVYPEHYVLDGRDHLKFDICATESEVTIDVEKTMRIMDGQKSFFVPCTLNINSSQESVICTCDVSSN